MLILWVVFASYSAVACICPADREIEPEAVFLGKAISIDPISSYKHFGNGPFNIVKLKVLYHFSGVKQDVMFVKTGIGTGDCGFDFLKDSTYMIYAEHDKNYPTLFKTSQCLPTKLVSSAVPSDIKGLNLQHINSIDRDMEYFRGSLFENYKSDLMAALAILMMLYFLYKLRQSSAG